MLTTVLSELKDGVSGKVVFVLAIFALMCIIAKIFAPIVWFLSVSTNIILRLIGIHPETKNEKVTEEEIRKNTQNAEEYIKERITYAVLDQL